jgi:protease-4
VLICLGVSLLLATPLDTTIDGHVVGRDPAVAVLDGVTTLHYRHRLRLRDERSAQGASLRLALGPWLLSAGGEWIRQGEVGAGVYDFGVGWRWARSVGVGVAVRDGHWSLGTQARPASWLALGASWRDPGDFELGLGLRPLGGERLELGADVRFTLAGEVERMRARARVDVVPGWGIEVAYGRGDPWVPGSMAWIGTSIALGQMETKVGLSAAESGHGALLDDSLIQLTWRERPQQSVLYRAAQEVAYVLDGSLREAGGLLAPQALLSEAMLTLQEMARDPQLGVLQLYIRSLDVGLATVQELRSALRGLRAAGKRVVAHVGSVDERGYMVAAACDEIVIDPAATVHIDGFYIANTYFGSGLAKLGIRFDSVEVGRYKSAPDALTKDHGRPEEHETIDALLEGSTVALQAALTEDRGLAPAEVNTLLAKGFLTAQEALQARLADRLSESDDPAAPVEFLPEWPLWRRSSVASRHWGSRPRVAVIGVVGTIVGEPGDNPLPGDTAAALWVVGQLDEAARAGGVAAVVLRVESPGGDVVASDHIWRAVRRVAQQKPIVVSMGDVAASGGYYVAAGAHAIYAQPTTVTGSIGIFAVRPDLSGLMSAIDVHTEIRKRGDHADWQHPSHPLRAADRDRLQAALERHYEGFLAKVAAGRRLPLARVREIAQGRVYTGADALDLGLVDHIGGLLEAIDHAGRLAGYPAGQVYDLQIPRGPSPLEAFFSNGASLEQRITAWSGLPLALLRLAPVYD